MRIIVCGAGRVGSTIARYLAEDDNDVVLIDTDEERLMDLTSTMDVRPVVGFASYPSVLEQADAQDTDMLIAVTASDEVNMVTCQAANSLFKVPTKIARLRSNEYTNQKWRKFYMTLCRSTSLFRPKSKSHGLSGAIFLSPARLKLFLWRWTRFTCWEFIATKCAR